MTLLLAFLIGGFLGVAVMCLMQMNRQDDDGM
jgi:hypothetical protein